MNDNLNQNNSFNQNNGMPNGVPPVNNGFNPNPGFTEPVMRNEPAPMNVDPTVAEFQNYTQSAPTPVSAPVEPNPVSGPMPVQEPAQGPVGPMPGPMGPMQTYQQGPIPEALQGPMGPMPTSSEPQMMEEPKNNKKLFLIIGVVVGAIIIGLLAYFIAKGINKAKAQRVLEEYQAQLKKEQEENEKISKNHTEKDYVLKNGNILIEIKNNNNVTTDGKVKVEFYDENETLVNTEEGYIFGMAPNATVYEEVYITSTKRDYHHYKITVKLEKALDGKTYNDKLAITSNKTEENIMLQITNQSSDIVERLDLGVLYFDEAGNIIGYSSITLSKLAAGETTSEKAFLPRGEDYKKADFAKYEVVVNEAYTSAL